MTDPAAVPSSTPYLIHTYEHRAYPLHEEGALSIGRDTACDITVNEVSVSRQHAGIKHDAGDFILSSSGATSTVLNGVPLTTPQVLREGDTFFVGTMKFIFTCDRLPVAMRIARPANRPSSVDARRPTLTFPQPATPEVPAQSKQGAWLTAGILAVVAVMGSAAYWFLVRQ